MTQTPVTTDSPQRAATFFDGFAETFDTIYDGKRGPFMRWFDRQFRSDMEKRYEKTFERFGDLHGKSVLDVGCGSGPYVVEAFRRGAERVTALDGISVCPVIAAKGRRPEPLGKSRPTAKKPQLAKRDSPSTDG